MAWVLVAVLLVVVAVLLRRKAGPVAGPVPPVPEPQLPAPDPPARYRVERRRNGELVECLAQGGGAQCRQVYEMVDAVNEGEEIRFMDGERVRSAKVK